MDRRDILFLYAYNRWANGRALAAATALTPEDVVRHLGTSHRSVLGTLTHILWGEWRWLGRWIAPDPLAIPDPLLCADLAGLQDRWAEVERVQFEFMLGLTDRALDRLITYENPPGTSWTYPLSQMLQHVVNHSTFHRGQVTTLLRQLRASPPATDLLVFVDEQGVGGGARTP